MRDDSDRPRHPLLHEPPVVPGWSRCYGSQGLTLVERLRARRLERPGGPHILRWTDGTTFALEDDQLSHGLFVSGTYEPNTVNLLRLILRDGDRFIDVGANAGVVSGAASRWVRRSRIQQGAQRKRIQPADRRYHQKSHLEHQRVSVGDSIALGSGRPPDCRRRLRRPEYAGSHVSVRARSGGPNGTSRATTLDEFLACNGIERIAAVKLDVEGAEGDALAGAHQMLTKTRPVLVVEVFSRSLQAQGGLVRSWQSFYDVPNSVPTPLTMPRAASCSYPTSTRLTSRISSRWLESSSIVH